MSGTFSSFALIVESAVVMRPNCFRVQFRFGAGVRVFCVVLLLLELGCRSHSKPVERMAEAVSEKSHEHSFGSILELKHVIPRDFWWDLVRVGLLVDGSFEVFNPVVALLLVSDCGADAEEMRWTELRCRLEDRLSALYWGEIPSPFCWLWVVRLLGLPVDLVQAGSARDLVLLASGGLWRDYWFCSPTLIVKGVPFEVVTLHGATSIVPRNRTGGSDVANGVLEGLANVDFEVRENRHLGTASRDSLLNAVEYAERLLLVDRLCEGRVDVSLTLSQIRAQAIAGVVLMH